MARRRQWFERRAGGPRARLDVRGREVVRHRSLPGGHTEGLREVAILALFLLVGTAGSVGALVAAGFQREPWRALIYVVGVLLGAYVVFFIGSLLFAFVQFGFLVALLRAVARRHGDGAPADAGRGALLAVIAFVVLLLAPGVLFDGQTVASVAALAVAFLRLPLALIAVVIRSADRS